MAAQDLELQLGVAKEEEYLNASAAVTDKVIFQLFANGSIVLTKKGGSAPGASTDQIEITAESKYTVKLTLADIEKLSAYYSNLTYTYKLYRWELLYQMPYDPVLFTGDITLLDRESEPISGIVFNFSGIGKTNSEIVDVNALESKPEFDLIQAGTNKNLYRKNAEGEYEVVNTPDLGGTLNTLTALAALTDDGVDFFAASGVNNFKGIKASGLSFGSFNITALEFTNSILNSATFAACTGASTIFDGCDLTGVNFANCDLSWISFVNAILIRAYLNGGIFSNSDFSGADLTGSEAMGAAFQTSNFTGATLVNVDLSTATVMGANFTNANLTGADFTGATCNATIFTGATMPTNADTKAEFKAVVGAGNWDAVTTIWTDGNPIGA